ncbi:3293_t:CDS:10 [Entrophospora sp. SA101]|nr:6853_t:CDS:10 [Entrophospora sp. SA101]CAJ0759972.1 3293_t:CDS:10 [Entrophospora sp. SA101]
MNPLQTSQNDQLWKLVEKQKVTIKNLQLDNQKLISVRDKLVTKLKNIDTLKVRTISNQIHPQPQQAQSQQSQNVKQNDNDSQQHRHPQSNSSIQILLPYQPIHNDSISSILSSSFTNSGTSVNALAGNYSDLESPNTSNATVKDDNNNNNNSKTLNDEHDSLILNPPNVNNNQKLDVSLNDNTISTTSMSTGNKSSPSPIIPPKSSQRQSSIRISNNLILNSPSQKPDSFNNDNNHEFQNDNNSPHNRPLSPSNSIMSVNSAKSYHNNVNAQSINVESDINDPDPLANKNQLTPPHSPGLPSSPKAFLHHNLSNTSINSMNNDNPNPSHQNIYQMKQPDSNENNRALKTSKSFDRYESNNHRLLNKNSNGSLYIPPRNQENSNNVVISPPSNKNNTENSSSPERVMQTSLLLGDSISGITVKVIGSNKKINDKGKEVLAFVIVVGKSKVVDAVVVGMEKELWRIEKLYSDFLGLDSKLKQKQLKSVVNKIGKLPDKTLFHNNSPSKADQRKLALEHYLLHAISLNLNDSKDLYEFLSSDVVEPDDKDDQLRGRKEGYLTKKGKSFGGWKTRYFVLDGPLLEYYESKDGSQLGFIRITNAQIGRQSNVNNDSDKDSENSYRHAFLILESKLNSKNAQTRHVLCAESDSDRDEWIEILLQYVGVSNNTGHNLISPRDDSEKIKGSTLEPKDPLPLGNSTTHLHKQLSLRRDRHNDEHKKAVRKTFFGSMFGSKDDKKKYQDPKPDSNKVVFGVSLDQAIAVSRIKENYELPAVVYRCIEYLDANNAAEEEGIYRLNGATATIKRLKERFNTEGDVDLLSEEEYYDVHAVAGLLKLYLRELPTSVLSRDLHLEFVNVIDLLGRKDRINELGRLVSALPLSNYTLLRTLTGHLIRIVQNAQINKMTARNIGIVFSPTLGIPASVFSLFMAEFDYIFFTNSDGVAAPRTMDASSEEPDVSKNSPVALLPVTAVRRIDIRDELTGRNNRNSVHYMDSAPEKVVGLEKRMTDEEDVNDLAIQAEQEEDDDDDEYDGSSIDETTTQSVPTSPRLHTTQLPTMNSIPTSSDLTKSNDTMDSMPGVFSEHQKQDYENENISLPTTIFQRL